MIKTHTITNNLGEEEEIVVDYANPPPSITISFSEEKFDVDSTEGLALSTYNGRIYVNREVIATNTLTVATEITTESTTIIVSEVTDVSIDPDSNLPEVVTNTVTTTETVSVSIGEGTSLLVLDPVTYSDSLNFPISVDPDTYADLDSATPVDVSGSGVTLSEPAELNVVNSQIRLDTGVSVAGTEWNVVLKWYSDSELVGVSKQLTKTETVGGVETETTFNVTEAIQPATLSFVDAVSFETLVLDGVEGGGSPDDS